MANWQFGEIEHGHDHTNAFFSNILRVGNNSQMERQHKSCLKNKSTFLSTFNWTYAQTLRTFAFANQQAAFSSIQSLFELVINGVGVE